MQLLKRLFQSLTARGTPRPPVARPLHPSSAPPSDAPRSAEVAFQQGLAFEHAGQFELAIEALDRCAVLDPARPDALARAGRLLLQCDQPAAALVRLEHALALDPAHSHARYNLGLALRRLRRHDAAANLFRRLVSEHPSDAEAWNNLGTVLAEQRRHAEAVEAFEHAVQIDAALLDARFNQAIAQMEMHRPDQAMQTLARLIELRPDHPGAAGKLLHACHQACAWHLIADLPQRIDGLIGRGVAAIDPFAYQAYATDPALQQACARLAWPHQVMPPLASAIQRPGVPQRRLRIGYVAGEFRQQATATLLAGVLECHDRRDFEVMAFDNGWDDGSPMRRRIERGVDRLVPIDDLDDAAAAGAVTALGIDILVDLNGFFGLPRPGLWARRPAPVQVNYLGFPGTLGSTTHGYIVADATVIPDCERAHYSEAVARLPHTYQPSDPMVTAGLLPQGVRADHGLPAQGFVFCCFNNNYKILPDVFAVWMRSLRRVPEAVLWLLCDNAAARDNLRQAAAAQQVAPERLVFADRVPHDQHLARLRLADLFLDTTPCNAHTTANDALRCGLPVLTCAGRTFSSRVAASLLGAAGLPQLVTHSLADYGELAVHLASQRADLARLRRMLEGEGPTLPLFDTARYTRNLEAAYRTMWRRFASGLPPADFAVHE